MESRRSKPGRSASGSKDDRRPAQPGLSSQGGHTASKRLAKGKGKAREDTSTLASKFHHSKQVVLRATKKARTFEIQKLVRKVKSDARKTASTTSEVPQVDHADLQAILVALKDLDIDKLASHALRSRLARDRSGLARLDEVQASMASMQVIAIDPTHILGKAQNRILASKVLVEQLNDVLNRLRQHAGLLTSNSDSPNKTKMMLETGRAGPSRLSSNQIERTANGEHRQEMSGRQQKTSGIALGAAPGRVLTSDSSDNEETSEEEFDDDDDETVSHISAEDDGEGDFSDVFRGIQRTDAQDDSDDDSDEDIRQGSRYSRSDAPPDHIPADIATLRQSKSTRRRAEPSVSPPSAMRPTTSAFLPSLAAGYTLGDSDGSVYSHSDDEGPGKGKPQRKNRRGQRARQAIWERKYGKNAKHVQKKLARDEETEENRKRTKAEKEIEAKKRSGRYIYGVDANLTELQPGAAKRQWPTNADSRDPDTDHTPDIRTLDLAKSGAMKKSSGTRPVHPSWEAKRKAKEALTSIATIAPSGKKIKFE